MSLNPYAESGPFQFSESQTMFGIGDTDDTYGDLIGNLDRLAVDFPDVLRGAMRLVAPVFLDICNNASPSCPIDTGRLISSSAVFVDNEQIDFGKLDYAVHGLLRLKGKAGNPRSIHRFSKFKKYSGQLAARHGVSSLLPESIDETSPLEVRISVLYGAPYATIQHDGINPETGEPFRNYTRPGSGPQWVTTKFTTHKGVLSHQMGWAVEKAMGAILGSMEGGSLAHAMSPISIRKSKYFNPNQARQFRSIGGASGKGFTFLDERGVKIGKGPDRYTPPHGFEFIPREGRERIFYSQPNIDFEEQVYLWNLGE